MKLFREVKASGDCLTYYTPKGYPIHLEPIDITEEELELLVYGFYEDSPIALVVNEDQFKKYFADYLIRAILSKLKDNGD